MVSQRTGERGQLILIGAVLVALTIVASVVLLNSIHASADIRAQQDRQNLEQAERVTGQVQNDLDDMFVANGSGTGIGDARYIVNGNESELAALVETYNEQYQNLSMRTRSSLVNVTFLPSESGRGSVVYQNESEPLGNWRPDKGSNIDILYLYVNVTDIDDSDVSIEIDNVPNNIRLDYNSGNSYEVLVNGDSKCADTTITPSQSLEIELNEGVGEIRTADCGTIAVDLGDEFEGSTGEIRFKDPQMKGKTTIVFDGTADTAPPASGKDYRGREDDAIVNPTFNIVYQDPSVTYEANVTLYGGGS